MTAAAPSHPADSAAPAGSVIQPRRDAFGACLVVLMVSTLGLGVTYYFAERAQVDATRHELAQIARIAATRMDGDAHAQLDTPEKEGGEDYRRVAAPLVDLVRVAEDVPYLYTAIERNGRIYYVVDTAAIVRRPGDTQPHVRVMEEYTGDDADFRRALATRTITVNATPQREPEGTYLSAYAPFTDRQGRVVGVVGVDMWMRALEGRLARLRGIALIAAAGLVALSALAGLLVFRLRTAAALAAARDDETRRALARARDAAEQSGRAKSAFLAMMSHELRTPLNAIVGYSELMHEELSQRGQESQAADIARVRTAGLHLSTIISDILDFSKIDAGRLELAPERLDPRAVRDDLLATLGPEATARGLTFVVDVRAGDVRLDPARFRQLLVNLAGNAVKFTERGTITVRLRPAPRDPSRLLCLVHDTGVGIPADKRGRLFKPFSQVDGSLTRSAGGTGLGLVICHRLVEAMGGQLRVRSRVGGGSTFRASLPAAILSARWAA